MMNQSPYSISCLSDIGRAWLEEATGVMEAIVTTTFAYFQRDDEGNRCKASFLLVDSFIFLGHSNR